MSLPYETRTRVWRSGSGPRDTPTPWECSRGGPQGLMRSYRAKIRRPRRRCCVLFGVWTFFAPTKLGGTSTYSVTDGISMNPLLYKGDFAVIRAQSSYHVGEVVLYESQVTGRYSIASS